MLMNLFISLLFLLQTVARCVGGANSWVCVCVHVVLYLSIFVRAYIDFSSFPIPLHSLTQTLTLISTLTTTT